VMRLCGDRNAARQLLREALGLLERKGNVPAANLARVQLESLRGDGAAPKQTKSGARA
jgi:hypothetical protein